jgi:hypothetical protein
VERIKGFARDWGQRHAHPINALLHLLGIPLTLLGLGLLLAGLARAGLASIAAGYGLQWLGHRAQGNEMGEWMLLKKIAERLRLPSRPKGGRAP